MTRRKEIQPACRYLLLSDLPQDCCLAHTRTFLDATQPPLLGFVSCWRLLSLSPSLPIWIQPPAPAPPVAAVSRAP